MVKKFFLLLLAFNFLFSFENSMLLIEAKLYPKIIFLLNKNPQKLKYAIMYSNETGDIAKKMRKLLSNYNVSFLKKYNPNFDVYIITYPIKEDVLKKLVLKRKIIFSIFPRFIDKAMFSIYLDTRIKPFVNPFLIKEAGLSVNPIIFKVGKIYEK